MNATIEHAEAELARLGKMLEEIKAQQPRNIRIFGMEVELRDGEEYAGIALDKGAQSGHHFILLPGDADPAPFEKQIEWAKSIGGHLPTRVEQAILHADFKDEFKPAYYWSGERHSDQSYAWYQYFGNGGQDYSHADSKLRARAVRRLVF